MKKVVFLALLSLIIVSCSTPQEKLINEFESVLGDITKISTFKDNTQLYLWENIDYEKTINLFGLTDKTLKQLPTGKKDNQFSDNDIVSTRKYETTQYLVTVEIYYLDLNKTEVKVFIDNK